MSTVDRADDGTSLVLELVSRPDSNPLPPVAEPLEAGCGASNTATLSHGRDGGISIDWLTVHQVHPQAPLLGDSLLLFCDLQTGEIRSQAVRGLTHRGSHDSSLQIRSDGRRIEVSGNSSRWGRRDNVFGLAGVSQCLELYNAVLRTLGLPEFYEEERPYLSPFQFQRSDTVCPAGPVITRVDLCRNWSAGDAASARSVLAGLGSVVLSGKAAWVSGDGCTVAWGVGSRYAYSKYYLKGPELRKHKGKSDADYTEKLIEWATSSGIVRQEISLKSMLLKRHGLDRPNRWTMEAMHELMESYSPHRRLGGGVSSFSEVQQRLEEEGVSRGRARLAQAAIFAYLAGHRFVVGEYMSRASFYRLRADLLLVGVDIAAPLNVSALPVRIRTLDLVPTAVPDWYRLAG